MLSVAKRRRKLARHKVPGLGPVSDTVLKGRRIEPHDIFRRPFRTRGDRRSIPGAVPQANFLQPSGLAGLKRAQKGFLSGKCHSALRRGGWMKARANEIAYDK
jgi:hypothetical protein